MEGLLLQGHGGATTMELSSSYKAINTATTPSLVARRNSLRLSCNRHLQCFEYRMWPTSLSFGCGPLRKHGGSSFRLPLAALMENASPSKQDFYTVGDFMTRLEDLVVVKPYTTIDEAIEMLVENRITGLPVVDNNGKLIGVVSDYDLLALDSISGKRPGEADLFPEAGSTWKAFKGIQKLLSKTQGKIVGDVMTPSPLVVQATSNLEDAARVLLETKYRRLPVIDDSGKLVGLITRGNVVRAALHVKREAEKTSRESNAE